MRQGNLRDGRALRLVSAVVLLLPIVLLLILGAGWMVLALWFSVAVLLLVVVGGALLAWFRLRAGGALVNDQGLNPPRWLSEAEQPEAVREVMSVDIATEQGGVRVFHGELRASARSVYEQLKRAFLVQRTVPLLQEAPRHAARIVLMPADASRAKLETPVHPWLHWGLFALTVLTTTEAGARLEGINLLREPAQFVVGLPYALALLSILGVHELGHYFAARWHGIQVTPPYFIPVPAGLGTFGAFIKMRSAAEDRRALFDMAVAGPLAGLVVAIPTLWFGLRSSTILESHPPDASAFPASPSILMAVLARLALGEALDSASAVQLSPLAFAGWLGLLITALNLVPIGQLDGGHIARAMFGNRVGTAISNVALWSLVLLAVLVWRGLLMWALLAWFLSGRSMPPLNDLTPISPARRWMGYATFLLLVAIWTPLH